MFKWLGRWLKIYQEEIGIFLWSALLLFLIRSSNILFNNFAETAFLKRFGVQYLPIITAVNSVSAFFILGILTGYMARIPGSRLLTNTLLFCGISVAALRFVIPLDFPLLYPVLYVLKTQYEVLLGLLFWDFANDLFNTRQSKRIFPLIAAGGIGGGMIGSFGTPFLVRAITMDNLMLAYLCTALAGAATARKMGQLFPPTLLSEKKAKKKDSGHHMIDELKRIVPFIKESTLAKVLILFTFLPNVIIPIMNYQFSFAVSQTFGTEGGMITFFGYFRGAQNVIALIMTLFVGRLYGRFGLPVALMFHPFNYLLAFLGFLFRFDIFSAMYARLSTAVLRTSINAPATSVLYGLFPPAYRAVIRPFLRGTVVRLAVLTGSGLVLLSQGFMQPRYLSLVACCFVLAWIGSTFFLKRRYSGILLDLITSDMLDFKSLEEEQASQIFKDKNVQTQLVRSFLAAQGDDALWYGRLLKSLGAEDLDAHILTKLREEDDRTKMKLLDLLSSRVGKKALDTFIELIEPNKPELMVAFARTVRRVYADMPFDVYQELFRKASNPEVRAYAMIALYRQAPSQYKPIIENWLRSDRLTERRAGVIAAGGSDDVQYAEKLAEMLEMEGDESIIPLILGALSSLEAPEINTLAYPFLSHPLAGVRMSALDVYRIVDDESTRAVIALLGDPSNQISERAIEKLENASYRNAQLLEEAILIPSRRIRDGIFRLVASMDIKDVELFRFSRAQLQMAYESLSEAEALRHLPENWRRDLLIDHLNQKRHVYVENVLRALTAHDHSRQMRVIWRGISSPDPRQKANSLEALENLVDSSLSRLMTPLLEDLPSSERLAVGQKNFKLAAFGSDSALLFSCLLKKDDWVTVVLTLYLGSSQDVDGMDKTAISELTESKDARIRQMAEWFLSGRDDFQAREEDTREGAASIPEKIFHLRGIELFRDLTVNELATVAWVIEEVVYGPGQILAEQGNTWDKMYMVVKGELSLEETNGRDQGASVELARIGAGGSLGKTALFEEIPRSISGRATEESILLVLHREAFREIVREYPEVALRMCKALCAQIRAFGEKVKQPDTIPRITT